MKTLEDQISAVHALEGRTLKSGWKVLSMHRPKPGSSGSNFSVCYSVERDGASGFMKVLNVLRFLQEDNPDLPKALELVLSNYNFEKNILEKCGTRRLSKVAKLLDCGHEHVAGFLIPNIHYLIFERAESDVRAFMNFSRNVDLAWKLKSLHSISIALQQLHSAEISHQDIKPSNAFVFADQSTKLGDLGRAITPDIPCAHSHLHFAGDPKYAPPEALHNYRMHDTSAAPYAVDCFMLGSLISFYFTGFNMTALMIQNFPLGFNWADYKGRFKEAVPYWQFALDKAIQHIRSSIDSMNPNDAEEMLGIVRALCQPEPEQRGHLLTRQEIGSNYLLHRIPPMFDKFAMRARIKVA